MKDISAQERLDFADECDRLAKEASRLGRGWLAYDLNCAALDERVYAGKYDNSHEEL